MEGGKPLRWVVRRFKSPPMGDVARMEAGTSLRHVQRGNTLGMPRSRPMPEIGKRVHELRIEDAEARVGWRIVYRIDPEAIVVVHWFEKKTERTPGRVIELCRRRLKEYERG
jgi:phage-related protein